MANEYGVFNQGTIVLEYWAGNVNLQELLEHERQQSQDVTIEHATMVIADCREAIFSLDQFDISAICESTLSRASYREKQVALIINPQTWDLASDYSAHFWGSSNNVLCFHSLEAACAWLELDGNNLQKRLMQVKQACMSQQII
jgi:hypothetical protein